MKPIRRYQGPAPTARAASPAETSAPYRALAPGYDFVMRYVDYETWAHYAHALLTRHHGQVRSVLELGCGTGTLALYLQPLGDYAYTATDRSPEMVEVAEAKMDAYGLPVVCAVADFTDFEVEAPFDAVVLLYDGMNYLMEPERVAQLLACAHCALHPGGIFIVDQSTPVNSLNNEAFFHDEGEEDGFHYVRGGYYDPEERLHVTTFDITDAAGRSWHERHVQRAYALEEMRALVEASPFEEEAAYAELSDRPADEHTERIHWVLRA